MMPIERILSTLPDAKPASKGWSARCPAHDDRRASLSISEGDDGRALIKCHAGCTVDAVCGAVGLRVVDLMPTADKLPVNSVNVNGNRRTPKKTALPLTPTDKPTGKTFATAREAVAELERRHGPRSALWIYHDAHGAPVGVVVRWDLPDGKKDIRPASRHGDGWRIGGMPGPRPLYGLPDLADAKRVYICEGEKAADAVRALGLAATASAHGSASAAQTDWTPLAGKEVVILPDHDAAGERYATDVAGLCHAAGARSVRVLRLAEHAPALPADGDAADVLADERWCGLGLGDAAEPADAASLFDRLADAVEPLAAPEPPADMPRWAPYPVDALPEPISGFVRAGAAALGCDPAYIAMPLLAALASAVGTTRVVALKASWHEPSVLWSAIVGESGTLKSPALDLALSFLRRRQAQAFAANAVGIESYDRAMTLHETDTKAWQRKGRAAGEPPPEAPERPVCTRYVMSDTTLEALADRLNENPRGLLVEADELSGWLRSFDKYRAGKGGDCAAWLSMHRAGPLTVDRKSATRPTLYVPRAAVSVTGGIQPGILRACIGREHVEDGLLARLLLACPPRRPKRWRDATVDRALTAALDDVFSRLLALRPVTDGDGEQEPLALPLTPAGRRAWVAWYESHAVACADMTGDMAAAAAKLEGYAARLALIVALVRSADATAVDAADVEAGATLARWHLREAERVYGMFLESDDDRDRRRLVEWLERRGGSATAREVQQGCRWLKEPGAAAAALDELAKAGWGNWEPTPRGQRGQPTRRFRLSTPSTVYGNSVSPQENGNTVDVATVDTPKTDVDAANAELLAAVADADEWGEL